MFIYLMLNVEHPFLGYLFCSELGSDKETHALNYHKMNSASQFETSFSNCVKWKRHIPKVHCLYVMFNHVYFMISLDLPWWFLQLHILDIRCIPEALPYFVTPKAVDEDSALLQQLPHWAACSITQALEFLTPAYKGHPRVMAYILRVLESYPPERVTFFMPQLVQALRYDDEVSNVMKMLIYVCVTIYILCIITGVLSLEN